MEAVVKKTDLPTPPATLSEAAAGHWWAIVAEWELSEPGLILLRSALEAFDRAAQARDILDRDGPLLSDRFGQLKAHPMAGVERDARQSMLQAMKSLGLDAPQLNPRGGMQPGAVRDA